MPIAGVQLDVGASYPASTGMSAVEATALLQLSDPHDPMGELVGEAVVAAARAHARAIDAHADHLQAVLDPLWQLQR